MNIGEINEKIAEKTDYLNIISKQHPAYQQTVNEIKKLKNKLFEASTKKETTENY